MWNCEVCVPSGGGDSRVKGLAWRAIVDEIVSREESPTVSRDDLYAIVAVEQTARQRRDGRVCYRFREVMR